MKCTMKNNISSSAKHKCLVIVTQRNALKVKLWCIFQVLQRIVMTDWMNPIRGEIFGTLFQEVFRYTACFIAEVSWTLENSKIHGTRWLSAAAAAAW